MTLIPRIAEYDSVIASVAGWAEGESCIVGVAVVGSWARGNHRHDSDIDIVVLTTDKQPFTTSDDWVEAAMGSLLPVIRRKEWGVLTERRVRLPSKTEVDFGFVLASWASTNPIDPGTAGVVKDGGLVPIFDPEGLLEPLTKH